MNCPEATMNWDDIIRLQLNALKNNKKDSGIKIAYQFASPMNKYNTGPYDKFKNMIIDNYSALLNFDYYKLFKKPVYKNNNRIVHQLVQVSKDNVMYIYKFILSKQYDYHNNRPIYDHYHKTCLNKYWRTDSVKLTNVFREYNNVYGEPLELCNLSPKTGFYRDGYCNTGPDDVGTHTVCARVTDEFLNFSKKKGNDLISANNKHQFPGLKDGNYWCLCANRYEEARQNNIKMKINKKATHQNTLKYTKI